MSPPPAPSAVPERFQRVTGLLGELLSGAPLRPELELEEMPAPQRLAPYAAAVMGTVLRGEGEDEEEIAMGRLIVLYDPAGRADWEGEFRLVAYIRADLEPEFADDELIGQVAWSWLLEALGHAGYARASGTITRTVSEGFGEKADEPAETELEMRASWSPESSPGEEFDLLAHVGAWAEVMCLAAGLPPAGVSLLPPRR